LPAASERIRQELALQIALGAPLVAAKGYAASEVEQAYVRARQLCQQLGEPPPLLTVLRGLWVWYAVRSKLTEARQLGGQLLALAHNTQDPAAYLEAYHALGQTFFHLGEFALAWENCEQGYAIYDPQQHHSHVFLYGTDPGIACLFWGSLALWFLGYPEQALQRSQTALSLAKELSYPLDLAYAFQGVASVHQYRREGQLAQKYAEATITLSTEQGLPFWLAFGVFIQGWSLAELGQEGGISQMRQGLTGWQTTGAQTWLPYYLTPLAEACINQGHLIEAESLLIEALSAVDKTGERTHEAELYRLKGELTLQQFNVQGSTFKVDIPRSAFRTPHSEAEACFLKAIDIARRQHAKMLELRATVSLARLWQSRGKKDEARTMLAEIYGWFTEGFDTKDLQDAKALLAELA
jgi:predicted ATPase